MGADVKLKTKKPKKRSAEEVADSDDVQLKKKTKGEKRKKTTESKDNGLAEHAEKIDESGKTSHRKRKRPKLANWQKDVRSLEKSGLVDVPSTVTTASSADHTQIKSFKDLDLDDRLLKVIAALGWSSPTPVQCALIPLLLERRNVLGRARTGSGKTAAFLLPILQSLLRYREVLSRTFFNNELQQADASTGPLAVILTPTKELAEQVHDLGQRFCAHIPQLQTLNLAELDKNETAVWKNERPHLVVATPGKLCAMLDIRDDFLRSVRFVVIDEADLLLGFGYEPEIVRIRSALPSNYTCALTSATLTDDMTQLKRLVVPGPVVTIKLKEGDLAGADQLTQYHVHVENDEQRFTVMVALVKLRLIAGKTIIFVNDIDRCYRLSLVLQAFGIQACILNAGMPANSRCHVINQFNAGRYNYVIASEDNTRVVSTVPDGETAESDEKPTKHKGRFDRESGVGRGIDFNHVTTVINFDLPPTLESYIHRVGRTARGTNKGTALTLSTASQKASFDEIADELALQFGHAVVQPYEIRMNELDTFVLRTREAMAACTRRVVKEARLAEIRHEALRSAKLQSYFAKNPREKQLLESDKKLARMKIYTHLIADVPDYMVPRALRGSNFSDPQEPSASSSSGGRPRGGGGRHRVPAAKKDKFRTSKAQHQARQKAKNPLMSFDV